MNNSNKNLNALGYKSKIPEHPDPETLEKVKNPKIGIEYSIRFTCPEFTSICPVTSQPDFAYIILDYVPNKFIVESKSFKLYLLGYRNHGAFHEDCTISIAQDIIKLLSPKWLRIGGYWYPRGGIPIDIFWQTGKTPKDLFIPDHSVENYKGRG